MTKKEYLQRYRQAERDFENAVHELTEIRSRYEGIKAIVYSDMPKAHDTERDLSDAMASIEEATKRCSRICNNSLSIMGEVQTVIDSVDDIDQRRVLQYRYVRGMQWAVIADVMGYSRQWVTVLHGRGLERITCF